MTAEAQAMHDELMTNCQDRFDDLVARGKSEDDAIAGVIESLKGMEEVVAAYPKKRACDDTVRDECDECDEDDGECVVRIGAEGLAALDYDVRNCDLQLEAYNGTDIVVRYDRDDGVSLDVRREGDCLRIATDGQERHRAVNDCESLMGALRGLVSHWINDFGSTDVTVSVPSELALRLNARSASGDIEAEGVRLTEADIGTASGDIKLRAPMDTRMSRLKLATASGDVAFRASADGISIKTMSGDIDGGCDCERLDCGSVSGDIKLEAACGEANLKSVSGDVRMKCELRAPRNIDAQSTSGNVRVSLPADANVRLSANTVSGSVRNAFSDSADPDATRVRAKSVSGNVDISKAR